MEPTMTEYNVYVEGEFIETLTRAEIMEKYDLNDKQFNNRVCGGSNKGTRRYKMSFARIYTVDSKSNIPIELLEDDKFRLNVARWVRTWYREENV